MIGPPFEIGRKRDSKQASLETARGGRPTLGFLFGHQFPVE